MVWLVDLFFELERPAVTLRIVSNTLGVTPKAAGDLVDRLVARDLLREVTGRSYNRVFVAPGIVAIISGPSTLFRHHVPPITHGR